MNYLPQDVVADLSYTDWNPIKAVYTNYTCDTGQRMWDTNCLVQAVLGDNAYHLSPRGWVTFIDKGKILLSGYKDEIIEQHGILKCDQEKLQDIDSEDIVSIRTNNFGAEVMVNDCENASYNDSDCVIDPASLDDIMLYYVHRDTKEWS